MFGETLKKLRASRGLTQAQLGKILKVSPSTIGMYEQNRRAPGLDILMQISDEFDFPFKELCEIANNTPLLQEDKLVEYKTIKSNPVKISEDVSTLFQVETKDIAKDLEKFKKELAKYENTTFDGEPLTDEARQSIISAIEVGLTLARQKNSGKI